MKQQFTEAWLREMQGKQQKIGMGSPSGRMKSGAVIKRSTVPTKVSTPSPFAPYELVLPGQMPGGKNAMGVRRDGRHYPNLRFQLWRDEAVYDLLQQWKTQPTITIPVRLQCLYWPSDRRTRDVSGMEDALFHVLVKAGVLKDDGLVYDCLWFRQSMNRKGPKVLITMSAWGV